MEQILQRNSVDQYKSDMIRYSIETNRRRSFPDYKDGLKIVQRRILYTMAFNLACLRKLVKTAQVTGKVMGKLHPHGDSSIDSAIKILCNWFETYVPLLYSESNMGSMQGDSAAASRYTEVMLSEFAIDAIFREMKDCPDIVDWTPNYSGNDKEPEYLPVAVPLLLINGCFGIGVGKTVSIPAHNINEVIDATLNLIDHPDDPVVLIPDQCLPCEIIETNWKQISNAGIGSFKVRGKIDIEIANKGTANEHYMLVIKSVPDRVIIDNGKDTGINYQINDLISKGKLPQVTDLVEDSHKTDIRYQIHLKKGSDPQYVKDFLYKSTQLQVTQYVNFEVLNGVEPMARMSYKSYLQSFLMQRKITKYRKYCIKLQDVKTQLHEKETCIMLIKSGKINQISAKIQKTKLKNDSELVEWLVNLLSITDLQAKFILNYPMKKLSPAYLRQYEEEAKKLKELETTYTNMILNENNLIQEIKDELMYFKKKYGIPRKSVVLKQSEISNIPQGLFNVVITENSFIKKLPINETVGSYRGDNPVNIIQIDNTSDLVLISAQGRAFKIPVHKIPLSEKNSIGLDIRILLKGITSDIVGVFDLAVLKKYANMRQKHFCVFCTENNYIKKLDLNDVMIATPSGVVMTKLNEGDRVKQVLLTDNNNDIVIYSKKKALRCSMKKDIPNYKRNTLGVYAMNTKDPLDGMSAITPGSTDIVVITEQGKINKFDISGLPKSERYKAGNTVIKLSKGDSIHTLYSVVDTDTLHILTKNSKYEVKVSDIPRLSSISPGTKVVPVKGDIILKVSLH